MVLHDEIIASKEPIEIYTIQGTGTRFLMDFLLGAGVPERSRPIPRYAKVTARFNDYEFTRCHCRHASPEVAFEGGWEEPRENARWIATVRNPWDCARTWQKKMAPPYFERTFVATWAHYLWRLQGRDVFYFALDCSDREAMLKSLVDFCGLTPEPGFVESYAKAWEPVGATPPRPTDVVTDDLKRELEFAYEWYEYYTENWGAQ